VYKKIILLVIGLLLLGTSLYILRKEPVRQGVILDDDFTSNSGSMNKRQTASNLLWTANGLNNSQIDQTRTPVVKDGAMITEGAGAGYAWVRTVNIFNRLKQSASFTSGSTDGAYAGLIISPVKNAGQQRQPANIAGTSIHLAWGITFLELRLYESPVKHQSLLIDNYPPLIADGTTEHYVELRQDSNDSDVVHIIGPDNTLHTIQNEHISELWGRTILIENYQPPATFATDKLSQIRQITAWKD
jgi:hypothetical protein